MLVVNSRIRIPDDEIEMAFVRSSGPGGQNVNKVASKAVLRWPVQTSPSLPEDVRRRFLERYRTRITVDGDLVLTSQRFRDQSRNAAEAKEKLRNMLQTVARPPAQRKPTRPTKASEARRIESKQARSRTKQMRRQVREE